MKSIEDWRKELLPSATKIADTVLQYLPDDGVLIDAGANLGLVTELVLQRKPKATAILFEPLPMYAAICRKLTGNVAVHQTGLSDYSGSGIIYANNSNLGWNTLDATYAKQNMTAYNVEITRLDDILFDRIDVMKIDVESWEGKLLKGARKTIDTFKPVLIIELCYGSSKVEWKEKVIELERLFSIGYKRVDYTTLPADIVLTI